MTRPRSHNTEELAKRIFASLLPADWQQREQKPDYRIDFLVEIFEQGRPSGRTFAVQLKGTESLKQSSRRAAFRFETEHLAYYLDCVQQPVFLVCIDVVNQRGYWCFLQGYALDFLNGQPWRTKKTITIRIPKTNTLTDIGSFRAAIESAYFRMASLYPAALPAAMQAEVQRLESLDPRFRIRVEADSESGINYICDPQETVETEFTLKGDPDTINRKYEDLINRGLPVDFDPGEFEVRGSPLWEHAAADCRTIHLKQTIDAVFRLRANESDKVVDFSGRFEGGLRELRFTGHSPGKLITSEFTLIVEKKPQVRSLKIQIPPTHWSGKRLSQLAGLQLLTPFCEVICTDGTITASILVNGLGLLSGKTNLDRLDAGRQCARTILAIAKACEIARGFDVDPLLPAEMGDEEVAEIERIYAVMQKGKHAASGSNMQITLTYPAGKILPALEQINSTSPVPLELYHREMYPFLGTKIRLGRLHVTLTHASLLGVKEDLLGRIRQMQDSAPVKLVFVGNPESLCIYRLLDDSQQQDEQ